MTGEDTELDRTVVDQIGDPLQHLLRNSETMALRITRHVLPSVNRKWEAFS